MTFGDHKGIIFIEYLAQGETIKPARYLEILKKIEKSDSEKKEALTDKESLSIAQQFQTSYDRGHKVTSTLVWKGRLESPPHFPESIPSVYFLVGAYGWNKVNERADRKFVRGGFKKLILRFRMAILLTNN